MQADEVRRLAEASASLEQVCQGWLVMRETLKDVLNCAQASDMGYGQKLGFIQNLVASALEAVEGSQGE